MRLSNEIAISKKTFQAEPKHMVFKTAINLKEFYTFITKYFKEKDLFCLCKIPGQSRY